MQPLLRRLVLLLSLASATVARGAPVATVVATPDRTSVAVGQTVVLDVVIDVPTGLHAQSHTPSQPNYIPLTVTPTPTPGVTFGPPQYPPGEEKTYGRLGPLNVYTGRVTVRLPATIEAGAGGISLAGVVRYQACDDRVCYTPKRVPFEASVTVGHSTGRQPVPTTAPTTTTETAPPTTRSLADLPTPAEPNPPAVPTQAFGLTLTDDAYVTAFAVAFVIGILFNAVPCVLPVVPLKIVGFYEAARHDRVRCVTLAGAFAAGLVATFAVLAVLVVGLRTLTWGGLFQQAWFTVAIVLVLLAMAASQFGLFTVNLPAGAYAFSPRHDTLFGNAAFGVLTAALSTPCTVGPFSALLVWALRQPPALGGLSVVVVGCGMASPYLLLSAFPQIVRRFPRTGPVGQIVKQTLAFFVLATAVYFSRPLVGAKLGRTAFWWALFAVVAAGMVFLVVRTVRSVGSRRAILVSSFVATAVTLATLAATIKIARQPYDWRPYSDAALAAARQSGRPVLIDFTADWCGNCHYLEAFVLNDARVVRAVRDGGVILLKADVTHGTEAAVPLKDRLVATGEIPLTVVYPPDGHEPKVLTGIYSAADLLALLRRAS